MKTFLSFAGALCIFAGTAVYGQSVVSRMPVSTPFKIDTGVSFSASIPKSSSAANAGVSMPAAERIISDIRQAIDVIRANHAAGARIAA